MSRVTAFVSRTALLMGVPALALAQSKSTGTPTIPTGPAVLADPSSLSGSVTVNLSGSDYSSTLYGLTFTLTPTSWEVSTKPSTVVCTLRNSTSMSKTSTSVGYYCSQLGSVTKNTVYTPSGLSSSSSDWSGVESAFTFTPGVFDLSTMSSTNSTGTLRYYTQNINVSKSGLTFPEKIHKVVLCAEKVAGVVFDRNVSGPTVSYPGSLLAAGIITHVGPGSDYPEMSIAYYQSGWQFAVAGPRPGKVIFRTPDSAKSALTTKTVTSNASSSWGKSSSTPTTSTVVTDDLSKGWFDLGPLETVNSSYCQAW